MADALAHALQERGIIGLGREIHREVDRRREAVAARRDALRRAHESAAPHRAVDEAAAPRLGIGARHRRVVEVELLGERALRRQALTRQEAP